MCGEEQILMWLHAQVFGQVCRSLSRRRLPAEGDVDHHVADDLDLPGDPLATEVLSRGVGGTEQEIAQLVGSDPVALLGHREVKRAHARLDVHDRHPRPLSRLCSGEGRVGVPIDHYSVGFDFGYQPLQCAEHPGGLGFVRPAADAKFPVGFRETKLGEEHLSKGNRRSAGLCAQVPPCALPATAPRQRQP